MADGGTVVIHINGDASGFEDEMDGAKESAESAGKESDAIFKGVFKSAVVTKGISMVTKGAAAMGKAIVGAGKAVVGSYADYEQLVGGVDTLFGDSSQKVQEYAAGAYKTAGLSANQYMETATSFAASLISSLGGDTDKAAEMTNMAITDMSDNANKMGTDMSSIQNAYQGFAKKNYTMLDNLKLGYGGTKEEMERLLADATAISGIDYDIESYADVIDAIHVIQESMGITGTTAEEAEGTITGSMNSLFSSVSNLITGLGDDDADLETLFTNVLDSLITLLNNLLPVVTTFIVESLPGIVQQIVDALPGVLEMLLENLPEMLTSLVKVAGQLAKMLIAMLPQILATIFDALPDILEQLFEDLPDIIEGLLEAVGTIIGDLVARLPELLPIIITGILRLIPALIRGLWKAISGMAGGIWSAVSSIFDLFFGGDSHSVDYAEKLSLMSDEDLAKEQERVEKAKGLYDDLLKDSTKTIQNAGDNYERIDPTEWLESKGMTEEEAAAIMGISPDEVVEYIDSYFNHWGGVEGIENYFQYTDDDAMAVQTEIDTRARPKVTIEGETNETSITDAVDTGVETAEEALEEQSVEVAVEPDFSDLTKEAFETFVTDEGVEVEIAAVADETASYKAGQDAITGLINGMESKRSDAVATGSSIASDVIAAIKAAFDEHSPSRVMMGIGSLAGEGLDIGLKESVGSAISNMRNLVTGINMTPRMDLSSIQGQLALINQTQGKGSVVLQLNGRELGRAAAPDMNTAVNGYTRRIAMGYGRG